MAKANFPSAPVAGNYYDVNGKTFLYRVTAGKGEFVAVAPGVVAVDTVAQIRTITNAPSIQSILLKGVPDKGRGGGTYIWDSTETAADDGATVIAVTGVATGRWVRVYDGLLDSRTFGYPIEADAATRMQAAADAANTNPAGFRIPFALPKNSELRLGQIRIGHGTGGDWSSGNNNNMMMGQFALYSNTTGVSNMAFGYEALDGNTTGSNNTAFGRSALRLNQVGSDSVAIGVDALKSSVNGRNTAVGRSAGDNLNLGQFNTLVGYKCLQQTFSIGLDSTASYNTFVGDNCASLLRDGNDNVAVGFQAMLAEPGNGAGSNASNNVFIGSSAGRDVLTSSACVGIGRLSMVLNRSGSGHTAVGFNSNSAIVAGTGNTAFGYEALRDSTVGLNTAVGYLAMSANSGFTNCAALGANTAVTGNNQVQLGDSATTTYVYGTVQNRSDARDKADIKDTELGLSFIESLRPVDYRWDMREDYKKEGESLANVVKDGSKKRNRFHHGFIAQELPSDFGGVQDHKTGGGDDVMSVGYDEFIAPMVKAIQELSAKLKELEARMDDGKR